MKFQYDHDLHIHTQLSLCSGDPAQTPERILKYAIDEGLKTICLTDHYWDERIPCPADWYRQQNTAHIREALPLPQADGIRFMFGCETEMDKNFNIAITDEMIEALDFIIIPTTHLHMTGLTIDSKDDALERRAVLWAHRFEALLNRKLPENKVGIAHPTCSLMASANLTDHLKVLDMIPDSVYFDLFSGAAEKKIGIEINMVISNLSPEEQLGKLRPLFIAKEAGCKFYVGSDTHMEAKLGLPKKENMLAIEMLQLTEDDKFIVR